MTGLQQPPSCRRRSHPCPHQTPGFSFVHRPLAARPCWPAILLPTTPPPSTPRHNRLAGQLQRPSHAASTRAAATPPPPPNSSGAPRWSRRAALLSLPTVAGALLLPGGWGDTALAALVGPPRQPLRSLGWSVPSELTVLNDLEGPLKVYWLNYDGDAELFGSLSPGSVFTVRTFESHAWRFVDGSSGATVAEHVMAAGQQIVRVAPSTAAAAAAAAGGALPGPGADRTMVSYTYTAASPDTAARPQEPPLGQQRSGGAVASESVATAPAPSPPAAAEPVVASRSKTASGDGLPSSPRFEGFDGLGNEEGQYSLAQLREIKIYPGGGNVLLVLPGILHPLELPVAGPEALSLVAATGSLEQRRPSTLGTWSRSLLASGVELRRVCITRVVDGVYYCRIVLSRPDSSLCSLDATPGDSLSLALQLGRPIYVSNEVARVHQSVLDVFARRRQAMEAAAARGVVDEAAEAEADREAQAALDSISREIPSAPRPVRAVEMDHQLLA